MPFKKVKARTLFEPLSKDEIYSIYSTSLEILESMGVKIPHVEILKKLEEIGAEVDYKTQIVRMPQCLVKECLKKLKRVEKIHARNSEYTLMPGEEVYFSTSGGMNWVIDPIKMERRDATLEDVRKAVIVSDALEFIHSVGAFVTPQDIPLPVREIRAYETALKNTEKHCFTWIPSVESAKYLIKIAETVAGGEEEHRKKPLLSGPVYLVSPLQYPKKGLEVYLEFAKRGLPVSASGMIMMGGTGPVTLAGSLALSAAESLSGIVMSQSICPKIDVGFDAMGYVLDMSTGNFTFGAPENALSGAAGIQLARYLGFSSGANVGLTDSNLPDQIAGYEKGMSMLYALLAGAEFVGCFGIHGVDQGVSLEQLMLDHEMASYTVRMLEGFDVTKETLALDVIKDVGIGGTFLPIKHTLKHFRKELWMPKISDRLNWPTWVQKGKKEATKRAREEAERILREHVPAPLERDLEKEIDEIVREAQKKLLA